MSANDLEADWNAVPDKISGDKKHSLDSDEEDDDGKNYEIMADDDIEGQEEGAGRFDGEVQITPFNMREELQEGHFDTDGNYHWKKDGKEIRDNWLENIDWVKIKERDKGPDGEPLPDSDGESSVGAPFDQIPVYRQMLELMKPGESVAKSLRRLGGNKTLSASERLRRKKAGITDNEEGDRGKVMELTELANKVLTETGNMDIYQETFEQIDTLVKGSQSKGKQPVKSYDDALDMYADDFDEKEKQRMSKRTLEDGEGSDSSRKFQKTDHQSTTGSAGVTSEVQWQYKWKPDSDDVYGPYSTEQMQSWVNEGYFKEAIWVRRVGQEGPFYSSQRIDFEIYL